MERFEHPSIIQQDPTDLVDWTSKYIFGSYYFSQGYPGLQGELDDYAVCSFPDRFKQVIPAKSTEVVQLLKPAITSYVSDYTRHSDHVIGSQIEAEIYRRFKSLERAREMVGVTTLQNLAGIALSSMISRELGLLGISEHTVVSTPLRTYARNPRYGRSILLEHLIDGKDSGHEVFRMLFADMRTELAYAQSEYTVRNIQRIAAKSAELTRVKRDIAGFIDTVRNNQEEPAA